MTDIPLPAARVLHAWLIDHPGATYREAADGIGVTVSMIGRLLAGLGAGAAERRDERPRGHL